MEQQVLLTIALWCLVVGALALVILLVRQQQISTQLRARNTALEDDLRARDEEARHLVSARLPALVDALSHMAADVPGPLHPHLANTPYGQNLQLVVALVTESVEKAMSRVDQSARTTLKAMMRTVQSLANEQQLAISTMQDRHDDPDVLEDLLRIDHANSQLGRRVQATAVLCGSWPGQQRSASSLTDIVRGATSRIRDYRRVDVHAQIDNAVISRAVEPVVLTLAEILDNAARHSQPNTSVEVNFRHAHNGTAIVIDDAGVGMNAEEIRRAAGLLAGREVADINRLGDPPQIGFAVIGVLAARYGFTVSVDTTSPFGGVRAVVFLPTALLTRIAPPAPARQEPAPTPVVTQAPSLTTPSHTPASTAGGLPKRRRHAPRTGVRPPATEQTLPPSAPSARPASETAAGMGAWQRGTRSGRDTESSDSEGNPQA
ncbi:MULTISPECIES: ATP-binding protein [Actinoalloteichus]|uniref:histidine kinase n=1 Tax=Actinoalloteichus fjordicus TaxID=1612552 RepID=A0AAC9LEB4_9PSEU|nr:MULTISPECIES: ATP-binding protein [Actinoalloteichus]APU16081.1 histidine kinase [Actinoalloteichus fjordicus]APU22146.1 histidine kinase [Actinoalloteichus sp. GBA129-24]